MSLAATLAAEGMRPASMLPSIKCSSCGEEIEISAMGDHICGKAPEAPEASKAAAPSMLNPFTLRAMNASGSKPAQPSPLQFGSPPVPPTPQTRERAASQGSKPPRPAPPHINAEVANKPFLAPPRSETPISPASSTRSGSSFGNKPPIVRSMTSPVPRLWDPRPPSPELSANLDCAFPPFPFTDETSSRPSTSSGRKTPVGSDRAPSRSDSRQGTKSPDSRQHIKPPDTQQDMKPLETRQEVKSQETVNSEPNPQKPPGQSKFSRMLNRMNTLKTGPFDPTRRRPSNDDRQQQEPKPLDRRRPSLSEDSTPAEAPLLSSTFVSDSPQTPSNGNPKSVDTSIPPTLAPKTYTDKKVPPARPVRPPTEDLSPDFLDALSTEPDNSLSSTSPPPPAPPVSLRDADRSNTFPRADDGKDGLLQLPTLSRMRSEPALRSNEHVVVDTSRSELSQVPQGIPPRGQSRDETRMDYRLQDAPPVPKPVQLHRSDSLHRPSGSDSSTASSVNSLRNTNSSSGTSPLTSAASSVDALSPLAQELRRQGEERGTRVTGLNNKSSVEPGMRAEQPKARQPPRNFARPSPPREIKQPVEQSLAIPVANIWPLESPTDPAMQNGRLRTIVERPVSPISTEYTVSKVLAPEANISPVTYPSDEYDPYRSGPPERPQFQQPLLSRTRSKNDHGAQSMRPDPLGFSKPQASYFPAQPPSTDETSRSETQSPPAEQPPPVPHEALRPQLTRRPTSAGKATCRGCGHVIEGKSVKAADGRLTGRWHKACFVCKTCHEPFTTADFYVIKNNPYCEHHYHEKNGSLCHGCHRGIEGQYLETTSSSNGATGEKKYHPRCFTCFNCRTVLSDDYFEIRGRVFCERHALAAMRAQPRNVGPGGAPAPGKPTGPGLAPYAASNLRAERRTTKLMTMM